MFVPTVLVMNAMSASALSGSVTGIVMAMVSPAVAICLGTVPMTGGSLSTFCTVTVKVSDAVFVFAPVASAIVSVTTFVPIAFGNGVSVTVRCGPVPVNVTAITGVPSILEVSTMLVGATSGIKTSTVISSDVPSFRVTSGTSVILAASGATTLTRNEFVVVS